MKKLISILWPFRKAQAKEGASSEKIYLAKCGHQTKRKDKVTAFGETIYTEIPIKGKSAEYCHLCLSKMAIKCAWCEGPIFIGDYITLYLPASIDFKISNGAVIYSKDPLLVIGCQRRNCAETGADYCGIWVPPGKIKRFTSGIELATANPGSVIISNNIGSSKETKIIPPK